MVIPGAAASRCKVPGRSARAGYRQINVRAVISAQRFEHQRVAMHAAEGGLTTNYGCCALQSSGGQCAAARSIVDLGTVATEAVDGCYPYRVVQHLVSGVQVL